MSKEILRPIVEATIVASEQMGFDLVTDSWECTFVYADLPHVEVSLRIGGMFQGIPEGEEH